MTFFQICKLWPAYRHPYGNICGTGAICIDPGYCVRVSSVYPSHRGGVALWRTHQASAANGEMHRSWDRSEEHTSELQSLMRISYAVFCLKKKTQNTKQSKTRKRHYK